MSAVLPPVTDCGCVTPLPCPAGPICCHLSGTDDPNAESVVPPDPTLAIPYWQYADDEDGDVIAVFYWNPATLSWDPQIPN